jgi:hypothetical protein
MTRRWTRLATARFVEELEQVRLLGGKGASVQLEDHFRPMRLLLPSLREVRRPVVLGGNIAFSGL